MDLEALGWTRELAAAMASPSLAGLTPARVISESRGQYQVATGASPAARGVPAPETPVLEREGEADQRHRHLAPAWCGARFVCGWCLGRLEC